MLDCLLLRTKVFIFKESIVPSIGQYPFWQPSPRIRCGFSPKIRMPQTRALNCFKFNHRQHVPGFLCHCDLDASGMTSCYSISRFFRIASGWVSGRCVCIVFVWIWTNWTKMQVPFVCVYVSHSTNPYGGLHICCTRDRSTAGRGCVRRKSSSNFVEFIIRTCFFLYEGCTHKFVLYNILRVGQLCIRSKISEFRQRGTLNNI